MTLLAFLYQKEQYFAEFPSVPSKLNIGILPETLVTVIVSGW